MPDRPNVVLIVADDMGYGDFGLFSEGRTRTPALDRLVSEGICLTQHYSGSPVCAPARAALLTGKYPHRTGGIDTLEGRGLDRIALRETTLADLLRRAGYRTGLVGKWHSGALDWRYHPNARGFDEFAGFRGGWQDYYRWRLDRNGSFQKTDGRYLTDVFTDEAAAFLRRHHRRPFFLHLAYNAPHFPLQAPAEEAHPFAATGRFNQGVSVLYGMIRRMDAGVSRLLDELKALGIQDNTLVMFTSDNGPQFGGKGDWCTDRFNCNFHGCKGNVYEGGIRVPMVLRWPAGLDGGGHFDGMVHFVDWLPTLVAAARGEVPRALDVDGANVLGAFRGEGGELPAVRFWQWNRYTPVPTCNAAMRDGKWKLVRPVLREAMVVSQADSAMDRALKYEPERFDDICREPEPPREIPQPAPAELYDLEADPGEQHDLAAAEPDRAARMLRELETWFEKVEAERRSIDD
jgi:arylsulfatase A-like enzyme